MYLYDISHIFNFIKMKPCDMLIKLNTCEIKNKNK